MSGPLHGLRILDFTSLLPGPYATMTLADLGADVLRIISGSHPDLAGFMPPIIGDTGISAAAAYLQRNKRCISLNLKDERAVKIVHRLIDGYDILMEQFRPGVMAGFGLDYGSLKSVKPTLIYCSLTGYGQTGPLRDRAGHDINYVARSGILSYSGRRDGAPAPCGMQIADIAAGSSNAVIGILAAVIFRSSSGAGQHIDISMTDGMTAFNAMYGACFLTDGRNPRPEGTLLNGGSIYDVYETSDGGFISVGAIEPGFFVKFCGIIGRPDLAPGGVCPPDVFEVKEQIKAIFKSRTRAEWEDAFRDADACVEPVLDLSEALGSEHAGDRGLVIEVPLTDGTMVKQLANPVKFSESMPEYRSAGVTRGIHTREVLEEFGYSAAEIEVFEKEGVLS
ncbi:MAG: CoA transferase [Spirochaetes bacterium]|nr:CoA transferase [Spirochaetota bacterium]